MSTNKITPTGWRVTLVQTKDDLPLKALPLTIGRTFDTSTEALQAAAFALDKHDSISEVQIWREVQQ